MNKKLRYFLFIALILSTVKGVAQNEPSRSDSVIQLYGVVMSTDSLRGLEATSVIVVGTGRGTITNDQGVFSIVVLKGDTIKFSSIGFKYKQIIIPKNLTG